MNVYQDIEVILTCIISLECTSISLELYLLILLSVFGKYQVLSCGGTGEFSGLIQICRFKHWDLLLPCWAWILTKSGKLHFGYKCLVAPPGGVILGHNGIWCAICIISFQLHPRSFHNFVLISLYTLWNVNIHCRQINTDNIAVTELLIYNPSLWNTNGLHVCGPTLKPWIV